MTLKLSSLEKVAKLKFPVVPLGSSPEDEASDATAGIAFMIPKKEISTVPDMGKWKRSQVRPGLVF